MAYKVYCSRCGTSEIVRSKLEVDHLTKKHWKEYNCGELAYDKVMARI